MRVFNRFLGRKLLLPRAWMSPKNLKEVIITKRIHTVVVDVKLDAATVDSGKC